MELKIVPSFAPSSVRQVHPEDILTEWPRVVGLLRTAMGEGSYSETDIAKGCLLGGWALWICEQEGKVLAVCITDIIDFPRQRKCLLRYMAGDMEEINRHAPRIEAYAIANGCNMLEAYTRKGMARLRPDWTQRYIILQKDLT